jgi:hypothetical protein
LNPVGTARFTARAAIDPNKVVVLAAVAAADDRAVGEAAEAAGTATGIAGGTKSRP